MLLDINRQMQPVYVNIVTSEVGKVLFKRLADAVAFVPSCRGKLSGQQNIIRTKLAYHFLCFAQAVITGKVVHFQSELFGFVHCFTDDTVLNAAPTEQFSVDFSAPGICTYNSLYIVHVYSSLIKCENCLMFSIPQKTAAVNRK